jgi:hypothetical protein
MGKATALISATLVGASILLIISVDRHSVIPTSASVPITSDPETSTPVPPETSAPLRMQASSEPSTTPSADPAPQPSPQVAEQVRTAVRRTVPSATVGVEVYDRAAGTALTSLDADQPFPSMSVVKLFIALDVLHQNGWALPSASTQQQISQMLSASDDDIASALWSSDGEGAIIERDAQLLSLTGTKPPTDAGEWGDTPTTPQDLVTTYRYIEDQLPAADRDLLYQAMYNASRTAADGFDQYFGIPNGLPGSTWAIKQGWGSSGSDAEMNTTGLVDADARYVVVVLASAPLSAYSILPAALTDGTAELRGLLSNP